MTRDTNYSAWRSNTNGLPTGRTGNKQKVEVRATSVGGLFPNTAPK
jgi:hypothetical protein